MTTNQARYLGTFEEAAGVLQELSVEQGSLRACVGPVRLILPKELMPLLRPHIGQRISILHTDIPGKEYLFRFLQKNKDNPERIESREEAPAALRLSKVGAAEMNFRPNIRGRVLW
jgi:hypothetical protein